MTQWRVSKRKGKPGAIVKEAENYILMNGKQPKTHKSLIVSFAIFDHFLFVVISLRFFILHFGIKTIYGIMQLELTSKPIWLTVCVLVWNDLKVHHTNLCLRMISFSIVVWDCLLEPIKKTTLLTFLSLSFAAFCYNKIVIKWKMLNCFFFFSRHGQLNALIIKKWTRASSMILRWFIESGLNSEGDAELLSSWLSPRWLSFLWSWLPLMISSSQFFFA